MNNIKKIKKQSGKLEDYNPQKFHDKTKHATKNLNISQSEIEIGAAHSILDGSSSSQIQEALINSAKNLTSEEYPDYQIAAARLLNQKIRKQVHGSWNPKPFLDIINKNEAIYDLKTLFSAYTKEELVEFGNYIDYNKDNNFVYAGLNQMQKAYLAKKDDKLIETPQEVFMLIALFAFNKYKKETRKELVLNTYIALSNFEISLPTPTMTQLRTKFNRYFSCNIIDAGDDKKTIANAAKSIYEIVASGAGLGISLVDLRELNADIDGGRLKHTGTLPLVKSFTKDTKAFVQGKRGGSSTMYKNFYSSEIEDWLLWGNNKGTEETRERDTDYCIIFNELFFDRYKNNKDITLFYANDVPKLSSYMGDDKEFSRLYKKYEKTVPKSNQKKIKAVDLFNSFLNERFLQARLYCGFAENLSGRSSFKAPIKTSNLCVKGDTKINIKVDEKYKTINIRDLGLYKDKLVLVESLNLDNNISEYKEITDFALMSESSKLLRITDEESGNFIECTEDHKIWTKNRGYIEAINLREDDDICVKAITKSKKMIKIEKIEQEESVYDITVKDNHNFYANNILVHNCLEIGVVMMPIYDTINIEKDIYFKTKDDLEEYYVLRNKLLFLSSEKKEMDKVILEMFNLYSFDKKSEHKTMDYFNLDGFVNPSEIGVCILAGVNMGMVTNERLPIVMDLLVRLLEELIDMNEYDLLETKKAALMRRTIGIGFSDIFHDLAKNKVFYNTKEGRQFISDRIEMATYYGTKTSIELAKERGSCTLVRDTKYYDGLVPLDWSSENINELLDIRSKMDWDSIRRDLKKYGIRHSTLWANAPFGASSLVSNATPGIEPPRELVGSKQGIPKLVPEIKKYGKYYTTAWSPEFNNIDYFKFVAVCQVWVDQSFSVNQYTNLMDYENNKVPLSVLTAEMLALRYYGGKTAYYQNTRSTNQADGLEEEVEQECSGGGCKI